MSRGISRPCENCSEVRRCVLTRVEVPGIAAADEGQTGQRVHVAEYLCATCRRALGYAS